jgi:cytochrome b
MTQASTKIKVWDRTVRLTHWAVAALVLWTFYDDSGGKIHRNIGYIAAGLVAYRLLWGFIGSESARFRDWWPTRARLRAYLPATLSGHPPRQLGHNPLVGLMMLAFWLLILALGVTGWMTRLDAFWGNQRLHDVHAVIAYALLGCIVVHVIAALGMSALHKENLIGAMITGNKRSAEKVTKT